LAGGAARWSLTTIADEGAEAAFRADVFFMKGGGVGWKQTLAA